MEQKSFPTVIGLNVGGKKFTTRLTTLRKYPDSMIAAMFSGRHNVDQDMEGNYFIDRSGKYFDHILEFLRDEQYLPPQKIHEEVLKEAEYFGISELVDRLKKLPHVQLSQALSSLDNINIQRYLRTRERVLQMAVANATKNITLQGTSKSFVLLIFYTKYLINYAVCESQKVNSHDDAVAVMVGKEKQPITVDVYIDNNDDNCIDNFFYMFLANLKKEDYYFNSDNFCPQKHEGWDLAEFEDYAYNFLGGKFLTFHWNLIPHILGSKKGS